VTEEAGIMIAFFLTYLAARLIDAGLGRPSGSRFEGVPEPACMTLVLTGTLGQVALELQINSPQSGDNCDNSLSTRTDWLQWNDGARLGRAGC
jgi:hypothetical protein